MSPKLPAPLRSALESILNIDHARPDVRCARKCDDQNRSSVTADGPTEETAMHETDIQEFTSEVIPVFHDRTVRISYSHNMSVSINRLPTEILRKIFKETTGGDCLQNMPLSHVCSHWRDNTLSDTLLWYHLDLNKIERLELATLLLCRSKQSPISVLYPVQMGESEREIGARCFQHISRITELELLLQGELPHFSPHASFKPAPALRRLHIGINSDLRAHRYFPTCLSFNFLPRLFRDHFPQLTQLTLVNCRFPWASGWYHGLTKLSIEYKAIVSPHPEDNDVLDVLRDCPDLVEFSLHALDLPRRTSSPTAVSLPRLRKLALFIMPSDFTYILSHIMTQPSLELRGHFQGQAWEIPPLLPSDPRHLPMLSCLRKITISHDSCRTLVMLGSTDSLENTRGRIRIHQSDVSGSYLNSLVSSFVAHYPLTSLLEVRAVDHCMTTAYHPFRRTLVGFLKHTPSVKFLALSLQDYMNIWGAFTVECETDTLFLPNLTSLVVHKMAMGESFHRFMSKWPSATGLRYLAFEGCTYSADATQWLAITQKFVPNALVEVMSTVKLAITSQPSSELFYKYARQKEI